MFDKKSFLKDSNVKMTRLEVHLLFILGLLIGPSQPGIFISSALNRPNKIVKELLNVFNVSYSAVKSTAALIHHSHM